MLLNYKRYLVLLLLSANFSHAASIAINSGGAATFKPTVAAVGSLPAVGNTAGDTRVVLSPISIYGWDGASWTDMGTGGAGVVTSVFGRNGVVVSANGDYTASQVTNVPAGSIAAVQIQAAINELDSEKQSLLVNSAGLAAALSDETGSGLAVFGTSPALLGNPTAPTQAALDNSTKISTTAYAEAAAAAKVIDSIADADTTHAPSRNAVFDALALKQDLLVNSAGLAAALSDETGSGFAVFGTSPALLGNPTAPTQAANDNSTKLATTAYADASSAATVIDSIADGDTTHAPSRNAVFDALALKQDLLVNSAGLAAALSDETGTGLSVFGTSPALLGNPTAPTQAALDNSTKISTTAYAETAASAKVIDSIADADTTHAPSRNAVFDALALKQDLLVNSAGLAAALSDETGTGLAVFGTSPALLGNPTAPTQAANDNSTKIATTAYTDAKVVQTITNGDTTHASSSDALFDALALKADDNLISNQLWVDKSGVDASCVMGDMHKPCLTIQAAATLIGNATGQADFNDATKRNYVVHVGAGIFTESPSFGTRPEIVLDVSSGAQIVGNLTYNFDQGAMGAGAIVVPTFVLQGNSARPFGGGGVHTGVLGNVLMNSTTGSSSVINMHIRNFGVVGNVDTNFSGGSGGITLGLFIEGSTVSGNIRELSGNSSITLYADNCNDSSTNSLGGVSGAVLLNVLNDIRFNGPVVSTFATHGKWVNVEFKSGQAHNFAAFTGTAQADSISYEYFQSNVPTKGTGTFTLLDTARGIRNTAAGTISSTTVQAALNELDTEKAPLASPTFTGVPLAPTAAPGTNNTQIATTAYADASSAAASSAAIVQTIINGDTTHASSSDALFDALALKQDLLVNSAGLAAALSDESGTGLAVFNNGPTFIAPALGTPASGVATNLTGTATALNIGGNAATSTAFAANPTDCAGGTFANVIAANGNLTCAAIALATDVSGILPIANGGTNSNTALSGSSIMISNGTSVIQGAAGTASTVLHGNAAGAPSYGAVALGSEVSGSLPIANGGTGQTAKTAAFDALSPLSVKGDLITHNGTNNIRLPVGADGFVLSANSAMASGLEYIAIPSAPVTSVFGRVGVVVSANGDYTASQVTNVPAGSIAAVTVQAALNELDSEKQALLVNSAGLAAALSDETGTGLSVFGTSPALLGSPTAPTQTANDNSTKIATTAYADASSAAAASASIVQTIINGDTTHASSSDALFDALALKEPNITATTSADYYRGDKTFQPFDAAAQAASISQVITNGVTTKAPSEDAVFDALALKQNLLTNSAGLAAALSDETGSGLSVFGTSPALLGTPTAPTAAFGTSTTQIATTAFVQAAQIPTVVDGGNAAYAIQVSDGHIRSGTTLTANRTYTLPACVANIGEKHSLKNLPAQTFNIILAGNGGDLIDGVASKTLLPGDALPVICAASGVWDIQQ